MSIPTHLEKQILATIVYYDILDYPLTGFEVFLYLVNGNYELRITNYELGDVCDLLNNSEYLKKYISQKYGFYFLKKRENIVQQRLDRKKLADQKWKKIKKIFWIMQVVPFMKMVLVSGSLALGNSRKESDVDLIITAKKGKIWTVRTFVTLLTSILGVRRYKNKTEDKICLNHYITDKSLKIPFESLYNAQSYLHLINVYNSKKDKELFRKFQEENKWIGKYVQNYEYSELGSFRSIKRNKISGFVSGFFEFVFSEKIGDYFEKKLSQIQSVRITKDPLYKKSGGRVTINNNQLEFHPDSHEANIIPEFNKRMEKLGLFEFANQKDSGLNV
jgi:predicted nucleotidyltransferase